MSPSGWKREIQEIPHVGDGASASNCVRCHAGPPTRGASRRAADGCTDAPEVFPATPGEGFRTGVAIPDVVEPSFRLAVGENVKEPQELPMDAARGGDHTGKKGICGAGRCGIRVAIAINLGACRGLQNLGRIGGTEAAILPDVLHVVPPEFVVDSNIDDEVAVAAKPYILENQVP